MGDSAGGGLVLSVLQVLRPNPEIFGRPAGAAVVSPWCDLTHSFPSVDLNKEYDIIPPFSFIHKPSLAWPPPFEEAHPTFPVHDKLDSPHQYADPIAASSTVPLLLPLDNESLQITTQIQIYAPNHLLAHPLVSPALANLTGLPPLLVLVSDKESLRDEGIFIAHRAAGKGEVRSHIKQAYPEMFVGEEAWSPGTVHLQVYDGEIDSSHCIVRFAELRSSRRITYSPGVQLHQDRSALLFYRRSQPKSNCKSGLSLVSLHRLPLSADTSLRPRSPITKSLASSLLPSNEEMLAIPKLISRCVGGFLVNRILLKTSSNGTDSIRRQHDSRTSWNSRRNSKIGGFRGARCWIFDSC